MINSHKEFVGEVKNFTDKMELINGFQYIKDLDSTLEMLENSEPRILFLGLIDMSMGEDYNMVLNYNFAISDEVLNDDDAILNSETENMFIVSALYDYLNYIKNTEFDFSNVSFDSKVDGENAYTAVAGTFTFTIKRSASYWKQMEAYSTTD